MVDENDPGTIDWVLTHQEGTTLENQHRQISGYRELSQEEIDLMNKVKETSSAIGEVVGELENQAETLGLDLRWLAIGKTDLQTGFMALVRSIAQPTTF